MKSNKRPAQAGLVTRRIFYGIGSLVLLLAVAFSILGPVTARRSFPQIDGEIQLAGLDGPVDVYRDSMGIPHIYATTMHDLFMAQGYVHAQERFWQMDFWRHIGSGRLSEMFGSSQVDTDMFLRTLGWRQIAEQEWGLLSTEFQSILNSYSEGVNAYLQSRTGAQLSLEYAVLGLLNPDYQPEPWTPIHSITWAKAMAWDLRGNLGAEIERAILLRTLTPEQVGQLFPDYPRDHPLIVPVIGENVGRPPQPTAGPNPVDFASLDLEAVADRLAVLDSVLGPSGSGIGSNSWAVSGKLSATGMPMLANDPHLGIQMPSIWYQVGLHCKPKSESCQFEVAGFSFAGVPGVVIGHNDRIGWGFTNTGPDVIDLFIEKVNPDNPNQYEVNGAWVDFETRQETILVGGGEPVEMTVRISRHGPVISETYGPLKDTVDPEVENDKAFKDEAGIELPAVYAIAMNWTALEPGSVFEAIWGFNKASNWDEFRQAARNFQVPPQNLLYADVDGNIGYQMPGRIPVRANGDGRLPVPGWTDEYEWTGYIPFDELPFVLNPESGYIVTANNQVNPWDYPYLVTTDWDYGFRAQRIVDMIQSAPGPIDIGYYQQMQFDSYNMNAELLVPLLMQLPMSDPRQVELRSLLGGWDYQNRADSNAAALFEVFWKNLLFDTFGDELPKRYWPGGGSRWNEVARSLVPTSDSPWWDDVGTSGVVEARDDMLARAFGEAVAEIETLLGKDPARWTWGELHYATFENGTLGQSGIGPIEAIFNRGPFPTGGGESIVNATGWTYTDGYFVDWLPSMRMILDFSNLNNSATVHTTGQSGHAYHPHYIDMARMWADGEYYPMWWEEQSVISAAEGHLRLVP